MPVHQLVESHIVNFFTHNLWSENVPPDIKKELCSEQILQEFSHQYNQIVDDGSKIDHQFPNTCSFIQRARMLSLHKSEEVVQSLADLTTDLLQMGSEQPPPFTQKGFMSIKKMHEVEATSRVVAMLCNTAECPTVVDIGGGKGYLSSVLTIHHNLNVLGLDSSRITTCGAVKRSKKVAKFWNQAKGSSSVKEYKQITTYVTPSLQVSQLVAQTFEESAAHRLVLAGLHTCGDLAPTCLRLFCEATEVQCLVNVGCCYHLMSEQFEQHPFWQDMDPCAEAGQAGFPLSTFLQQRKLTLGRNARMIAAHCFERMLVAETVQPSVKSIFYRALLETVVQKSKGYNLKEGQVGRLGSKCNNFHEYMYGALRLLDLKLLSDSEVTNIYITYKQQLAQLEAYFLLRCAVAPLVESIILLDRLLYLHEQGYTSSRLVCMFDAVTSPRCFGVVAWK